MTFKRKHFIVSLVLLVALVVPVSAQQGTSTITGRVADNSGAIVPGVNVSLTSPAVMGTKDALTDERGGYRFDLLPAGAYSLKFELPGFATLIRGGIQVSGGFTATINVALEVANQAETITVTGQSPVVDTQNATLAVNLPSMMLSNLPTARDMVGIMGMAPGIMMTKFDVGGSQTGTALGYRTYGTDGQNYALLDGVIETNILYGDFGSSEEVQVIAASKTADIKVAGAYTNQIVKSGSNAYHGDMEAYYEGPKLQGTNLTDKLRAQGLTGTNRISKYYDINTDIGGPIKKDKFWWYFSARRNWVGVYSPGFKKGGCADEKGCQFAPIGTYADSTSNEDQVFFTDLPTGTAKLNFQINPSNQLTWTENWAAKIQPFRGGFGSSAGYYNADSTAHQNYPSWISKAQWASVINSRITMDTSFGSHFIHWPHTRRVNEYSRRDIDTLQVRGGFSGENTGFPTVTGNQVPNTSDEDRWQYRLNFSMLTDHLITGSHNIKFGFQKDKNWRRSIDDGTVGQLILYYAKGFTAPAFIETLDDPGATMGGNKSWAVYINDSWKATPKLTLNLGFRFDSATPYYEKMEKTGNGPYQAPLSIPARNLFTMSSPLPRLSFAYDVFGDGKTALKASYGRYAKDPDGGLSSIGALVNPVQLTKIRYAWDGINPSLTCYRTLCSFDPTGKTPVSRTGGLNNDVDPNDKFPITTEYTLGIDRELVADFSLRIFAVRKFEQNNFQLDNIAIPYSAYNIPVSSVDPGRDSTLGTSDDRTITLYNLQPSFVGGYEGLYRNNSAQSNAATTIETTIIKRFSKKWQMLSGFDYLYRKTWNGAVPQDPNTLLYNTGQHYNTWHFKASGTYEAPYGLKLSAVYRAARGNAYGRRLNSPRLNQGVQVLTVEPIGTFFTDKFNLVDLRAEKTFTVSERWGKIGLIFDVFNAANSSAVVANNDLTGATFQKPTQTIEPRIARIGARYTF